MYQIYLASITPLMEENFYQKALPMVSHDRQEKAERMKQHSDKARSIAAGLLFNFSTDSQWEDLCVAGTHGKPMLPEETGIYFNLSHSGEYAVCAISDQEIGIDIQEHEEYREKLAERFFHPEEIAYLKTASDPKQCFYDLWCMKESCIKYTGRGLSMGLESFSAIPLLEGKRLEFDGKQCEGELNPSYRIVDLKKYVEDQLQDKAADPVPCEAEVYAPLKGYSLAVVKSV